VVDTRINGRSAGIFDERRAPELAPSMLMSLVRLIIATHRTVAAPWHLPAALMRLALEPRRCASASDQASAISIQVGA
jgi:hypothetical protein